MRRDRQAVGIGELLYGLAGHIARVATISLVFSTLTGPSRTGMGVTNTLTQITVQNFLLEPESHVFDQEL